jgi:hypothetical protein
MNWLGLFSASLGPNKTGPLATFLATIRNFRPNDSAKVMTMRSSSSGKPIRAGARQIADLLYQKFPRDHTEQREGRIKLYDVAPPASLCFRKPSLIASLIPSSINVFATSGTLVP